MVKDSAVSSREKFEIACCSSRLCVWPIKNPKAFPHLTHRKKRINTRISVFKQQPRRADPIGRINFILFSFHVVPQGSVFGPLKIPKRFFAAALLSAVLLHLTRKKSTKTHISVSPAAAWSCRCVRKVHFIFFFFKARKKDYQPPPLLGDDDAVSVALQEKKQKKKQKP